MVSAKFCSNCGAKIEDRATNCAKCGSALSDNLLPKSDKSAVATLLLCMFLGSLGVHRFYVGKIKTGILMLLTAGGLGIWTLVDLIRIACCDFKDRNGNYLIFTRGRASSLKLVLIIVGSVMVALVTMATLLLTLVFYLTSPMINVIQDQLTALHSGDTEKAYNYLSDETKKSVTIDEFKKYVDSYPIMYTNVSVSFPDREMKNGEGLVITTLKSNDGSKTKVEYNLVKKNNMWKISSLRVDETGNSVVTNEGDHMLFEDQANHFTITYPASWEYQQRNKNSVMFSGKEGTDSYFTTVTIQVLPTKANGGMYESVKDVVEDLKEQINSQAKNVKFSDSGVIDLPHDPKKYSGEYFMVTYDYKGYTMKKVQFVIIQKNGDVIYSFGLTATEAQFNKDLPIARAMFESWKINQ